MWHSTDATRRPALTSSSSGPHSTATRRRATNGIAVFALAVLWQLPYFDRWMSMTDEGHILAYADLLSKGGELYRDAEALPLPGAFYFLEFAFEWFGPSVVLARWIVVIQFALLCVIALALLGRIGSLTLTWAGASALLLYRIWAFPHWHMYSYSSSSLLLLAVALYGVVRFFETERAWILAGAGFAAGLAVLCKQDYGAGGSLGLVVAIAVWARTGPPRDAPPLWNSLATFVAPAALVGLWVSVRFYRLGLLDTLLEQTILFHLGAIATFDYTSLPPLFPLFSQDAALRSSEGFLVYAPAILPTVDWGRFTESTLYRETIVFDLGTKLAFYAPYAIALFGLIRCLWRRKHLGDPRTRGPALVELTLVLHATSLIAIFNKPVEWVQLLVLYWPFVCLGAIYVDAARCWRPRTMRWIGTVTALPAAAFIAYTVFLGWQLGSTFDTPLPGNDRAGIFVTAEDAEIVSEAIEYLEAHSAPGEAIAVLPYYPLLSFLADRPSPHRSAYVFWPVPYFESREAEIVAALEAGPGHLLYHVNQFPQFPPMSEFAPTVFEHLVEHWEFDRVISGGGFSPTLVGLKRVAGTPRGRPLLAPDAPLPSVRIEDADGIARAVAPERSGNYVKADRWPFRPVLALRPVSRGGRTVAAVPLDVPSVARVTTALGVHPNRWFMHPASTVSFRIEAVDAGEHVPLFERTLDPSRQREDRGWLGVDIDLADFAGRSITLEFSAACEGSGCEVFEMGGFEAPRVTTTRVPGAATPRGDGR